MNRLWLYPILCCIVLLPTATVSYAAPVGMIGYQTAKGADYLIGYETLCDERGIEYDIIGESDAANMEFLGQYNVLIVVTGVGERVGLTDAIMEAVRTYLLAGGSVIMEQLAGNRFPGLPISASTPQGLKIPKLIITGTEHPITAGLAKGQEIAYGGSGVKVSVQEPDVVTVLADTDKGPGLVVAATGRGQLIYTSICLSLFINKSAAHRQLLSQILDAAVAYDPTASPQASTAPIAHLLAEQRRTLREQYNKLRRCGASLSDSTDDAARTTIRRLSELRRSLGPETDRASILQGLSQARAAARQLTAALIQHLSENPLPMSPDFYNMRVASVKLPRDLSPDDADLFAAKYYSLGVNLILFGGRGGGFQRASEDRDQDIAATRNLVAACHKFGMRAVHHVTCAMSPMPQELTKWAQRDARTGEMTVWGRRKINLYCTNNLEFRREYFAFMKDYKQQTNIDGFMVDEVEWLPNWFVCGCDVCRERFKGETGFTLPTGEESEHWGNFDSPLWRAWIRARQRWVGDFYKAFGEAVIDEGDVWYGCLAGGAQINMPVNWGDELEEFMRSHNIAFFENYGWHHFYMWLEDAPRMAYYSGTAVHFQTPALTLFYPTDNNDFICSWAYMKAFGHNVWANEGYMSSEAMGECFEFERDHSAIYSRPTRIADTAVLWSRRTRDWYYPHMRNSYIPEWRGWCHTLTAANRPYDVIIEGDITAEKLSAYKLLILPAFVSMSSQEAETITDFVRAGGNLIVAGEAGLWDETGKARPQPLLKEICGVSVSKPDALTYTITAPTDKRLSSALVGKDIAGRLAGVSDTTAEIISQAQTADGTRPFLLRNSFGKGTVLTITGRLGVLAHMRRSLGQNSKPIPYKDSRMPEACELALQLIELAHPEPWPLQAPSTDECDRMISALSHRLASGKQAIVIHQLNIAGTRLEEGELVKPWPNDVTWPQTEPVEVTLRTEAAPVCAYAISPDYDAAQLDAKAGEYPGVPVELSHQAGQTRVQLPALGRYAAVVIELAD